jgi:hypothetical protein
LAVLDWHSHICSYFGTHENTVAKRQPEAAKETAIEAVIEAAKCRHAKKESFHR